MYKGFGKDVIKKGPTVVKNYIKTYGSRFFKWARTPYPKDKQITFKKSNNSIPTKNRQ